MKPIFYLHLVLIAVAAAAYPIVIRPDVPDSQYVVPDNSFPPLADLPNEGHGELITKQWVVTAAHAVRWGTPSQVMIDGKARTVASLIVHPDFNMPPMKLLMAKSGDSAPLMEALASMHDIALIKLVRPVNDVKPVELYRGTDELGKMVELFGKGATGNGAVGQFPKSSHRGKLRRAYNKITGVSEKWINYRFDCGTRALPQEGVMGDGDSGGPVLIKTDGKWELAGLADWKHWKGDLSKFREGICGQTFSNVRISHYAGWIDSVISANK